MYTSTTTAAALEAMSNGLGRVAKRPLQAPGVDPVGTMQLANRVERRPTARPRFGAPSCSLSFPPAARYSELANACTCCVLFPALTGAGNKTLLRSTMYNVHRDTMEMS